MMGGADSIGRLLRLRLAMTGAWVSYFSNAMLAYSNP